MNDFIYSKAAAHACASRGWAREGRELPIEFKVAAAERASKWEQQLQVKSFLIFMPHFTALAFISRIVAPDSQRMAMIDDDDVAAEAVMREMMS
jgi:hypothetical protein